MKSYLTSSENTYWGNDMYTNRMLLEEMNKKVYGHERAKKALITLVKRAKLRSYQKWALLDPEPVDALNCLLIGDSGTGKTYMLEILSKILDFPYLCIDATSLTPTGNNDGINQKKLKASIVTTVEEYLLNSRTCFSHDAALDQMVIFVDEIDKLANSFDSSGNWNKHVQANFLTAIDGDEQLKGISWVFAGAFSGITRKRKSNALGFSGVNVEEDIPVDDEAVIKAGLIPELVGRVGMITLLDTFDEQDYLNILNTLVLPDKYKQMDKCHIEYERVDEETKKEFVKKVSKQGVRGLKRHVENHYLDAEFDRKEVLFIEEIISFPNGNIR